MMHHLSTVEVYELYLLWCCINCRHIPQVLESIVKLIQLEGCVSYQLQYVKHKVDVCLSLVNLFIVCCSAMCIQTVWCRVAKYGRITNMGLLWYDRPAALCGLRGRKNWPAPFPGRMSYKATKPGLVSVLYLSMCYTVLLFVRAPFYHHHQV